LTWSDPYIEATVTGSPDLASLKEDVPVLCDLLRHRRLQSRSKVSDSGMNRSCLKSDARRKPNRQSPKKLITLRLTSWHGSCSRNASAYQH
jgi:hypothetical protein